MKRKATHTSSEIKPKTKKTAKITKRRIKSTEESTQLDSLDFDINKIPTSLTELGYEDDYNEIATSLSLPEEFLAFDVNGGNIISPENDLMITSMITNDQKLETLTETIRKSEKELNNLLKQSLKKGNFEFASRIIDSEGFNPNSKGEGGNTALHFVAWEKQPKLTKKLIDKGADPKAKNDIGNSALHISALKGRSENIDVLYEAGAGLFDKNKLGHTPFNYSESLTFTKAVKYHDNINDIKHAYSEDVIKDFRDEDGNTALHHSVARGMHDVTKFILESGFSPQIKNNDGKKPEELSPTSCHFSTRLLLNQYNELPTQIKTR